ncbi:DUF6538 domain-containing protein [Methylobacter psychrophilus]|uniref:DUF6538 domain-containing protein n=1 Tax=Methylobacter psychrophilus TaxID=96941 RepID=UPI00374E0778
MLHKLLHILLHAVCRTGEKPCSPPSPYYLIKRRQTYYYRRRIPVLLRLLFGCLKFIISLKTTCFQDAKNWLIAMMTTLANSSIKNP